MMYVRTAYGVAERVIPSRPVSDYELIEIAVWGLIANGYSAIVKDMIADHDHQICLISELGDVFRK